MIIAFLLGTILKVCGQSKPLFPNLTKVCIDTAVKVVFGYDKTTTRFINKPCYKLDTKDPLHCDKDSIFATWILVAKYKNKNMNDSLYIIYSQGMSEDMVFELATKPDASTRIGSFYCLEFYINSLGTIYTAGHTNNMFNMRRKFQLQGDTIREVRQPFYYVGLKGKTLNEITLYAVKSGKDIVAQLPADYEIEILLAEYAEKDTEMGTRFLVRTEFGLVGWLRVEGFAEGVLKELYFAGD